MKLDNYGLVEIQSDLIKNRKVTVYNTVKREFFTCGLFSRIE